MTERLRRAGQVSWAVVGVAALLAIAGLVAWTVRVIFPPLILAGAIVFLLNPLVTRLQRRGIPRAAGAALAYLAVVTMVAVVGVLVVPLATSQGRQLAQDWPRIQARAERWIDDRARESSGTFWEFSRDELTRSLQPENLSLREQLNRVFKVGMRVAHVVLILVLAPIIAFYLLVDVPRIREVAESLIPPGARDEVLHVAGRLNRAIGGFFRGQLLVALIVGVVCSIGLAVIGLKFWFLVGMIAGLFNVIPLIGPWVGGIPGVIIALTTGSPLQALLVVVIMVGAQQLDNHFITPQVMQRTVELHPAVVILALLAAGTLGGLFALLFAVPAAAILKIICGHIWHVHVLGQPVPEVADRQEAHEAETGPGLVREVVAGSSGDAEEGEPASTGTSPAAPSRLSP